MVGLALIRETLERLVIFMGSGAHSDGHDCSFRHGRSVRFGNRLAVLKDLDTRPGRATVRDRLRTGGSDGAQEISNPANHNSERNQGGDRVPRIGRSPSLKSIEIQAKVDPGKRNRDRPRKSSSPVRSPWAVSPDGYLPKARKPRRAIRMSPSVSPCPLQFPPIRMSPSFSPD